MPENNKKIDRLAQIAGWTGAIAGSLYGLIFLLLGYFLKWGPGSGIEGGIVNVLLVSIPTILVGALAGAWLMRLVSRLISTGKSNLLFFLGKGILLGALYAGIVCGICFVISFVMITITGAAHIGDSLLVLIKNSLLMGLIFGALFGWIFGLLYGIFAWFYLKH